MPKDNHIDLIGVPAQLALDQNRAEVERFRSEFMNSVDPVRQWYLDNGVRIGQAREQLK